MPCRQWHAQRSLFVLASILGALAAIPPGVQSIGVCYGVDGDDLPSASDVVQLYKDNGIDSVRIYSPDADLLQALSGSDIAVTLGVPNADVASLTSDPSNATAWVRDNVLAFPGVAFRYIAVGNEVDGGDTGSVLPAMRNIRSALSAAGLADIIKVSTAVHVGILAVSFPPSAGTFNRSYMTPIAKFLQSTGAPLLANVYPYYSYISNEGAVDINYALFTSSGTVVDDISGYQYQNLFDAMVDAFYSTLEDAGAGNVDVVVSESGWPSTGSNVASASNAQTYSQNLINHVGQGTPKRPVGIEAYIFATSSDVQNTGAETQRHFGLFKRDKSMAHPIDFVGGTDP
ncbi:Glucan endo-1,3-beta-glucosidase, acidic isoform [Dichanthelium oligosanthes]|uniref:Glucan endo-1,3-beta-glucosidase, acidic isoform n=1 Tax=Dichanthelium oligosanthes TaxID=888268 RepID=A0A1E5VST4_9POAL|nr:Glucan endo-1,3-beta-glucosidase, acidic isoform [Dichanthelium oligosanthes]